MIQTPRSTSLARCSVLLALLMMNACGASASPHAPPSVASRAPRSADAHSGSEEKMAAPAAAPGAAPASRTSSAGMTSPSPAAPPAPVAPGAQAARPGDAPAAPVKGTTPAAPNESKAKTAAAENNTSIRAMLVFTGQMGLVVEHDQGPKTLDKTIDLAEKLGGHVASRVDNTVVIKVPSASFRDAMTEIGKLGTVTKEAISTEDVTEEYHDGEVRLQNLKATRQRLQEFLAKAANINDALTVERELERVAQEIDRLEGRMRFLRERAAYSQITLTVTPKPAPQPIAEPAPKPAEVKMPRKILDLPAGWITNLGVDGLLKLR
ncbi:MAG: DUF4349 domain-containing protein [Polyangiaceae bacterium]